MKQRKAQEQVLPKRGKPRVSVEVTVSGLLVHIPWAVIERKQQGRIWREVQVAPNSQYQAKKWGTAVVVDNLGDLGYGGDER